MAATVPIRWPERSETKIATFLSEPPILRRPRSDRSDARASDREALRADGTHDDRRSE